MVGQNNSTLVDTDLADEIDQAWRLSAKAHHGQGMLGTNLPYIVHIALVFSEAMIALQQEKFENPKLTALCAILHDTIEDTSVTYAEIASLFGTGVANGVKALSKNSELPFNERMSDSLTRIKRQPPEVWIVKLADRTVNMHQPPDHWPTKKRLSYAQEAQLIADELGVASPYLLQRLLDRIDRYKSSIPFDDRDD